MDTPSSSAPSGRFEVRTTADSHFSWLRTRLSIERTMMSWARTAVSLIGFGFTIVQFFEKFSAMQGVGPAELPTAPRYLGLALIGCGVASLVISLIQYRQGLAYMWGPEFKAIAGEHTSPTATPVVAVCLVLTLIGIFAFMAVLLRAV
ncbi:MAG TPA: DUF202 domain-containing protein [Burkholderiaceae bacterium]|jgi:putative membrane protein|nr:DUF202 domain-containing protein [Burkholderiaceae bacterium]